MRKTALAYLLLGLWMVGGAVPGSAAQQAAPATTVAAAPAELPLGGGATAQPPAVVSPSRPQDGPACAAVAPAARECAQPAQPDAAFIFACGACSAVECLDHRYGSSCTGNGFTGTCIGSAAGGPLTCSDRTFHCICALD